MKRLMFMVLLTCAACTTKEGTPSPETSLARPETTDVSDELARWHAQAQNVTIIRDNWGVPHIYGKTDADAVFGVLYAQAEDDFNRIEVNYMTAMGRLSEAMGEDEIYRDLRVRLFIEEGELKRLYSEAPAWLKELMNAYADGLNYYLHTHPETKPRVIKRFEPWMALSFSEGSIGGDIERGVSMSLLENFYAGTNKVAENSFDHEMDFVGSNGIAIAPSKTKNGLALLYINPHTSHYFREEAHMVSDEGLNAYGAITWGQFFIYQGFNSKNGWMHTSNRSDVFDEYLETITEKDGKYFYQHGDEVKPVREQLVTISYQTDTGMKSHEFTAYHTHHGPVVREQDGKWVSIQMMNVPLTALDQSYTRTKTSSYAEFYAMMRLKSNSSNNTVYADADGNIAYFHGNYHPIRDLNFDWNHPVDGSDPATDWKGLHPVEEAINALNPGSGWLYNSNSSPFFLTEPGFNPKREDYPSYMTQAFQNARAEHALGLFPGIDEFTVNSLIEAMYDPFLTTFAEIVPDLVAAYEGAPAVVKAELKAPLELLSAWDFRGGVNSEPAALATFWGNELLLLKPTRKDTYSEYEFLLNDITAEQHLSALTAALAVMEADYGSWKVPFGEIFRFQRISGEVNQVFDDNAPSEPVGMASHHWGALAIHEIPVDRSEQRTRKKYGTGGQSWIGSVEFGDRVKAKALTAGGLSNVPGSAHFDDQAEMYAKGIFRDVYFYREDVEANMERTYHPGE